MSPAISSLAIAILFLTNGCLAAGPTAVPLGTAANFAILAKSGISTVPNSLITGDIGLSPAAATFLTGFALTRSTDGTYATSTQVIGRAYTSTYTSPTPTTLIAAVSDVATAYLNASGRVNPDHLNLGGGGLGGLTLAPGLYKWTTSVNIATAVTLAGLPTDTWIFQIAGDLTIAHAQSVILVGASAANIVWVVAGAVSLGTSSSFEGIILGGTSITLQTGSSINGRLLAGTDVGLQSPSLNLVYNFALDFRRISTTPTMHAAFIFTLIGIHI
ncbi:antifreeze protein [Athelia psychrophila]|uniref:Antifreeze protein n=1 Tax=Athelia psychrophila TaxID=1759441 RepID=A0A167U5E0_9AGAM|nr:antifreeze protein [Fibularhizoctonia sp. CBS 109695]